MIRRLTRYDSLLGVSMAVCVIFAIWMIASINKSLNDAQLQMRAMPRAFLIDVINTQNQVSVFKQQLQLYLENPTEQRLQDARNRQLRLMNRPKLLQLSVFRLHIPVEKITSFSEELGYLSASVRGMGAILSGTPSQIQGDSSKIENLLVNIEDSTAFLYTEANVLLQWQASHQIGVLDSMSTTLTVMGTIIIIMFIGLMLALRKVSLQKNSLQKLATEDPLTMLKNRRSFDDILKIEFARVKRTGGQLSLLILDLDHFKQFNDSYGHALGDDALIRVAQVLRRTMKRQDDWAFRIGGEEFGCLLSTDTQSAAKEMAELIRKGIMDLDIPHRTSTTADVLTVSIGIAHLPNPDIHTENDLYVNADNAMYEAKRSGRNQVRSGRALGHHLRVVPEVVV